MKRGEIWVLRDEGYASKPRPVVVIQSDEITQFQSVVLCLLTSFDSTNIPTRVRIEPSVALIVKISFRIFQHHKGTLENAILRGI